MNRWRAWGKRRAGRDIPFVLLANVILLTQVDEVGDRLGSEELETVDNVDLEISPTTLAKSQTTMECRARDKATLKKRGYERKGGSEKENSLIGILGRYSRLDELG